MWPRTNANIFFSCFEVLFRHVREMLTCIRNLCVRGSIIGQGRKVRLKKSTRTRRAKLRRKEELRMLTSLGSSTAKKTNVLLEKGEVVDAFAS